MVRFVNNIPEVLEQPEYKDVVDQLEEYFDLSNALHKAFTDVINHWIDMASEKLASSCSQEGAAGGGGDTTHGGIDDDDSLGFSNLELVGASGGFEQQGATNSAYDSQMTSDRPANTDKLASAQTHDQVTQFSATDPRVPTDEKPHRATGGGQILGGTDTGGVAGGGATYQQVECKQPGIFLRAS